MQATLTRGAFKGIVDYVYEKSKEQGLKPKKITLLNNISLLLSGGQRKWSSLSSNWDDNEEKTFNLIESNAAQYGLKDYIDILVSSLKDSQRFNEMMKSTDGKRDIELSKEVTESGEYDAISSSLSLSLFSLQMAMDSARTKQDFERVKEQVLNLVNETQGLKRPAGFLFNMANNLDSLFDDKREDAISLLEEALNSVRTPDKREFKVDMPILELHDSKEQLEAAILCNLGMNYIEHDNDKAIAYFVESASFNMAVSAFNAGNLLSDKFRANKHLDDELVQSLYQYIDAISLLASDKGRQRALDYSNQEDMILFNALNNIHTIISEDAQHAFTSQLVNAIEFAMPKCNKATAYLLSRYHSDTQLKGLNKTDCVNKQLNFLTSFFIQEILSSRVTSIACSRTHKPEDTFSEDVFNDLKEIDFEPHFIQAYSKEPDLLKISPIHDMLEVWHIVLGRLGWGFQGEFAIDGEGKKWLVVNCEHVNIKEYYFEYFESLGKDFSEYDVIMLPTFGSFTGEHDTETNQAGLAYFPAIIKERDGLPALVHLGNGSSVDILVSQNEELNRKRAPASRVFKNDLRYAVRGQHIPIFMNCALYGIRYDQDNHYIFAGSTADIAYPITCLETSVLANIELQKDYYENKFNPTLALHSRAYLGYVMATFAKEISKMYPVPSEGLNYTESSNEKALLTKAFGL